MSKLVDVSHTVEHGMITYKGLPAPLISDFLSREESRGRYASGTEFHIGKIEMVANTGTYLDSPFHRYARGKDLAALDLYSIANLDGVVVHVSGREISEESFSGIEVQGKAVLVHTGWDKHWRTEDYSNGNHPFLNEAAATHLAKSGAALVGIDSFNIDATHDGMQALADGKFNYIVECNPLLGPQLMDLAKQVVAGEQVPERVVTPDEAFDQQQAAAVLPDRKY